MGADDVSRLLSAKCGFVFQHGLPDPAISNRTTHELDVAIPKCVFETEVAHDGVDEFALAREMAVEGALAYARARHDVGIIRHHHPALACVEHLVGLERKRADLAERDTVLVTRLDLLDSASIDAATTRPTACFSFFTGPPADFRSGFQEISLTGNELFSRLLEPVLIRKPV